MMNPSEQKLSEKLFPGVRFLFVGASVVVVVAGLKAAQSLLLPFLFAIFLAIVGSAPVSALKRRKIPTSIAVLIVAVILLGALTGIGALLGTAVTQFTKALPQYRTHLEEVTDSVDQWFQERDLRMSSAYLFESAEPGAVMDLLGKTLGGLVGFLSKSVLVIIFVIFMLVEAADFRLKAQAALGHSVDIDRFGRTASDVQRYLVIKTATSAITGVVVGVWVSVMGMDFPLLWGFIAFLLNYIPFVGSIIAAVPPVILAIVELGTGGAASLALGYIVINSGVSHFLEPILMGRRLGLSPLVVLLSLLFWGWVWGPVGMLMSVPLTMVVKILFENSHEFNWIAILMDVKPRKIPAPRPE